MKTMKRTAVVLGAFIAFIALGCAIPVLERPAETEAGVLRVSLGGGSGRTLLPELPANYTVTSLYYTLRFTATAGPAQAEGLEPVSGTIAIGEASGEFTLAAGTWNLEVQGFASQGDAEDPANALVSGGADNIAISGSAGASISVALSPDIAKLTQDASGTLA